MRIDNVKIVKVFQVLFLILGMFLSQLTAQNIERNTNSVRQDTISYNTTLIGRCALGPAYTVRASGNLVLFGNGGYLEVYDVTTPASPVKLSEIVTPSVVRGISAIGNYVIAFAEHFAS